MDRIILRAKTMQQSQNVDFFKVLGRFLSMVCWTILLPKSKPSNFAFSLTNTEKILKNHGFTNFFFTLKILYISENKEKSVIHTKNT